MTNISQDTIRDGSKDGKAEIEKLSIAKIARNVLKCEFTKHIGVMDQRKDQQKRMASAMKEKGHKLKGIEVRAWQG